MSMKICLKKDRYKILALNTFIFAIGNFGSKILSLLLNNLYTKHITPTEFYIKNLIEITALFLLPVFTFCLTEAIVRFGLDMQYDKKKIFTTCCIITILGLLLMAAFVPFLRLIPFLKPINSYTFLLIVYIWASSMRSLCSQFIRAQGFVKLFSLDGIITTLTLFLFSLIFVSYFEMGVEGFMLSVIFSDACSAIFLFFAAGLRKFFVWNAFDKKLGKEMLHFTLPLVPTIVMWTVVTFSDQIFLGNMRSDRVELGSSVAGLYAAAAKIPNLISMLSTIFFQAWNMSAVTEHNAPDSSVFYGTVCKFYESVLFIGSAGLVLFVKPVSIILINSSNFPEYSTVYIYTPLLITAAIFNCMSEFLYSIYTVVKRTKNAFYTSMITCSINFFLNIILIPKFGIYGAATATLISYVSCYFIRLIDTRRFVPFSVDITKNIINTTLMLIICLLTIFNVKYCCVYSSFLFFLIAGFNLYKLFGFSKRKRKNVSNSQHLLR